MHKVILDMYVGGKDRMVVTLGRDVYIKEELTIA